VGLLSAICCLLSLSLSAISVPGPHLGPDLRSSPLSCMGEVRPSESASYGCSWRWYRGPTPSGETTPGRPEVTSGPRIRVRGGNRLEVSATRRFLRLMFSRGLCTPRVARGRRSKLNSRTQYELRNPCPGPSYRR